MAQLPAQYEHIIVPTGDRRLRREIVRKADQQDLIEKYNQKK